MRQLDAEARRFWSRRMVRVTLALGALLVVVVLAIGTAKGHKASERTITFGGEPVVTNPDGSQNDVPQFVVSTNDTRLNVGRDLRDALEGTGVALLFVGIALGASFVGAEHNVGSLTTQLLFEPRRGRVHAAKAVAAALGGAVFAFAILALVGFAMYAGSAINGITTGVDGSFVVHRVLESLRVAGAVGTGTAFGYAVTLVARRSSAGMMLFFFQYPLLFLLNPAKKPYGFISHYAPLRGLLAVVLDPAHANGVNERTIHTLAGGVALTVFWLVVLLGSSGYWFSRAEIR